MSSTTGLLGDTSGAKFSECRKYRYSLWRKWSWPPQPRIAVFVGLNPSTADETKNDPTIRRCIKFSQDWGADWYVMLNLFAWRDTHPRNVALAEDRGIDIVGPGNDDEIKAMIHQAYIVVAAWGASGLAIGRSDKVLGMLTARQRVYCLGVNDDGSPKHPLYVAGETMPSVYRWERAA